MSRNSWGLYLPGADAKWRMSNRELSGQLPATWVQKTERKTQLWSRDWLNCQTDTCPSVRGNKHTTVYLVFLENPPNQTQLPPFLIMGLKEDAHSAGYTTGLVYLFWFVFYFLQNTHPLNGSRAWDWILDVPVKPVLLAIDTYDDCCS